MKSFCLVLVLVGLACAADVIDSSLSDNSTIVEKPRLPANIISNATQCIYLVKDGRLSCRSGEQNIECEATLENEGERAYNIFGIERCNNNNKRKVANVSVVAKVVRGVVVDVEEQRNNKSSTVAEVDYASYRFNLFPRRLDNESYLLNEQTVNGSSVRYSLYYGEKRVDYGIRVEKLACWSRLIRAFNESDERHNVLVDNKEVVLFGEVLIRDKQVSKRWFYGYGFYPFAHYWGWGGYPYGAWWGRK